MICTTRSLQKMMLFNDVIMHSFLHQSKDDENHQRCGQVQGSDPPQAFLAKPIRLQSHLIFIIILVIHFPKKTFLQVTIFTINYIDILTYKGI